MYINAGLSSARVGHFSFFALIQKKPDTRAVCALTVKRNEITIFAMWLALDIWSFDSQRQDCALTHDTQTECVAVMDKTRN